jgi:hypothetical protein
MLLDCDGVAAPMVVKVERRDGGGWRSTCSLCQSITLYWWEPGHRERIDADQDPTYRVASDGGRPHPRPAIAAATASRRQ